MAEKRRVTVALLCSLLGCLCFPYGIYQRAHEREHDLMVCHNADIRNETC